MYILCVHQAPLAKDLCSFATNMKTILEKVTMQSYDELFQCTHIIPSTSADAVFHSQQVHLQVQIWASNKDFVPENWGLDWYRTIYDQ